MAVMALQRIACGSLIAPIAPLDMARYVKRRILVPTMQRLSNPVLASAAWIGPKRISAMVRVKNEQEFLRAAVLSIVDHVDEVVIIDNMSTDTTAEIVQELAREHPEKIRVRTYPHTVARYGEENRRLAATRRGRRSASLIANYYNWCVAQCSYPFILKWDGDTVATAHFGAVLERFRTAPQQSLWHWGVNLHEDRQHLVLQKAREDPEPRLFYRRFARYTNGLGYCELLVSPYVYPRERYIERCDLPLYVHMKYCKTDRFENMSDDLQAEARGNSSPGQPIESIVADTIERWQLGNRKVG